MLFTIEMICKTFAEIDTFDLFNMAYRESIIITYIVIAFIHSLL